MLEFISQKDLFSFENCVLAPIQTHIGSSRACQAHYAFLSWVNMQKQLRTSSLLSSSASLMMRVQEVSPTHCNVLISNSQSLHLTVCALYVFAPCRQVHTHVCGTWGQYWWSFLVAFHLTFWDKISHWAGTRPLPRLVSQRAWGLPVSSHLSTEVVDELCIQVSIWTQHL